MALFTADGRLSRSALEEIAAGAGDPGALPGIPSYAGEAGLVHVETPPSGLWARITAGPLSISQTLYSFAAVQDDGTGYGSETIAGGLTGTNNAAPANGSSTVPADPSTGAVVWLWPDDENPGFYKFFWTDSGSAPPLIATQAVYTNPVFPNNTLTTVNWSGAFIADLGTGSALTLSGTNLQFAATGVYRLNLNLRPQFNPIVAGTYGGWLTRNAPAGTPPFYASGYDAGSLYSFPGGLAVPNPGCSVTSVIHIGSLPTTLYVQLFQNTGGTIILAATVVAQKIG